MLESNTLKEAIDDDMWILQDDVTKEYFISLFYNSLIVKNPIELSTELIVFFKKVNDNPFAFLRTPIDRFRLLSLFIVKNNVKINKVRVKFLNLEKHFLELDNPKDYYIEKWFSL